MMNNNFTNSLADEID